LYQHSTYTRKFPFLFISLFPSHTVPRPEEEEEDKDKSKDTRKRKKSENGSSPTPLSSSLPALPVLLAENMSKIITDFAILGFAGSETIPQISQIFQGIVSGTRG
jgi:hypothetical protein